MKYIEIYKSESLGFDGSFGIKIEVASSKGFPNLKKNNILFAIEKAQRGIVSEIRAEIKKNDPKTKIEIENNKLLLTLFSKPIYTEEIQNEYCSDWCCRHLPWFIVTTSVGRFKIGWRKRVINIDWSDTKDTKSANDLFEDENTTKGDKYIHAWNLNDAKRYIEMIMNNLN